MSGYGFEVKQLEYRRRLWYWVEDQIGRKVPIGRRVVAYLDTGEAIETQFLLALGYAPGNLHAVNINPAEVAVLTKRLDSLGLPRVKTHGIDFVRTLREAAVQRWHVMSFDGCGPVASPNTLRCVRRMSELATAGAIVSANVLAGRDTGEAANILRAEKHAGNSTHERRWEWLLRAFTARLRDGKATQIHGVAATKRGLYVSASGQRMLWLAVRLALTDPTGFYGDMRRSADRYRVRTAPGRSFALSKSAGGRNILAKIQTRNAEVAEVVAGFQDDIDAIERRNNGILIDEQARTSK